MRKSIAISSFLATAFSLISQTYAEPDPNFHIYLAFGQSNMEGAGEIESQDKTVDKRFQMLSAYGGCHDREEGNWYDAIPPLANCNGNLGPVDYFGRTLVKELPEEIRVGVVVVAVAGCDIQLFEKDKYQSYNMESWMQNIVQGYGGNPYVRLVDMAKKAQEEGVIKGILLHQGETNTGQQDWPNRVKGVYENLLSDLGLNAEEVPLLAGEVVSSGSGGVCGGMNDIIDTLPSVIPTAHVISSEGLDQRGDGLHFTSEAYRTFGQRFAEEMLKYIDTTPAPAAEVPANDAEVPANDAEVPANDAEVPDNDAPTSGAPIIGSEAPIDAPKSLPDETTTKQTIYDNFGSSSFTQPVAVPVSAPETAAPSSSSKQAIFDKYIETNPPKALPHKKTSEAPVSTPETPASIPEKPIKEKPVKEKSKGSTAKQAILHRYMESKGKASPASPKEDAKKAPSTKQTIMDEFIKNNTGGTAIPSVAAPKTISTPDASVVIPDHPPVIPTGGDAPTTKQAIFDHFVGQGPTTKAIPDDAPTTKAVPDAETTKQIIMGNHNGEPVTSTKAIPDAETTKQIIIGNHDGKPVSSPSVAVPGDVPEISFDLPEHPPVLPTSHGSTKQSIFDHFIGSAGQAPPAIPSEAPDSLPKAPAKSSSTKQALLDRYLSNKSGKSSTKKVPDVSEDAPATKADFSSTKQAILNKVLNGTKTTKSDPEDVPALPADDVPSTSTKQVIMDEYVKSHTEVSVVPEEPEEPVVKPEETPEEPEPVAVPEETPEEPEGQEEETTESSSEEQDELDDTGVTEVQDDSEVVEANPESIEEEPVNAAVADATVKSLECNIKKSKIITKSKCKKSPINLKSKLPSQVKSQKEKAQKAGKVCAAKHAQCGGKGFNGPSCCAKGTTCKVINKYYSKCV